MKTKFILAGLLALAALWLPVTAAAVGTWSPVTNLPPASVASFVLLSDGTVLAQGGDDSTAVNTWFRLTPDLGGHYAGGTWSTNASSTYTRFYDCKAVLTNGNVFVAGGEDGNGSSFAEVYNPTNNSWTTSGNLGFGLADGNAVLLNNGKILVEPQGTVTPYGSTWTIDPKTFATAQTAGAPVYGLGESTWVKLPNDNLLLIASANSSYGTTNVEQYNPNTGLWSNAYTSGTVGSIWPDLDNAFPGGGGIVSEMGPAFLLPNGKAIFFGGNGNTVVYNGSGNWSNGPVIPNSKVAADAPGAMMPNGKILIEVGPALNNNSSNTWTTPSSFYEYDYTANSGAGGFTQTTAPGGGSTINEVMFIGRMLALPDGTILWADASRQLYVYTPDGSPTVLGQPTIYSVSQNADGTLHLTGTLFNGISQGASYGDDAQMDSNYPLVRFTDSAGHVRYGRTYNWSSTSVMTGANILTTECTIPSGASLNDSIQVVANGIASTPVVPSYAINGITWVDFNYSGGGNNGAFATPYNTMATGAGGAASGGLIEVKTGTSSETLSLTKPGRIVSYNGTVHIGP